jgi:hypothetical protein
MISWFTLTFRGAVFLGLPSLPIQPAFDHFVASVYYKMLPGIKGTSMSACCLNRTLPRRGEFPLLAGCSRWHSKPERPLTFADLPLSAEFCLCNLNGRCRSSRSSSEWQFTIFVTVGLGSVPEID